MKHSNIYEKCHSLLNNYNEYYLRGTTVTFCDIIHANLKISTPSVIIRRYEA